MAGRSKDRVARCQPVLIPKKVGDFCDNIPYCNTALQSGGIWLHFMSQLLRLICLERYSVSCHWLLLSKSALRANNSQPRGPQRDHI